MRALVLAAVVGLLPAVAVGQDEEADLDEIEDALNEEIEAKDAATQTPSEEPLPEIGEDQLQKFVLERGFYFSGDLGMFETFGGTKSVSNLQPYLAVKAGFDIGDFFGVEAYFSSGFSSGSGASDNDNPNNPIFVQGAQAVNYGLLNFGAGVVGALRPGSRIAIEPKVGFGYTIITPEITDSQDINKRVNSDYHVSFGADLKYLTLLTDFTAGISVTGYYLPTTGIFGLAESFVVRYTF